MRDKTAGFGGGQNSRFSKPTKSPILIMRQNRRFVLIQIANFCKDKSCSRQKRRGLNIDN